MPGIIILSLFLYLCQAPAATQQIKPVICHDHSRSCFNLGSAYFSVNGLIKMIEILTSSYSRRTFSKSHLTELDLGCGKGGYLLSLAELFPDRVIVGADVMLGRLRKIQKKIDRNNLKNVQLLRINAWNLIGYGLPDHSISRMHILCPDPWPKVRHRSKRLISSEFLGRAAQKIVPGGILHLSTDDDQYYSFMLDAITQLPCYKKANHAIDDIRHCKTDFELRFERTGLNVNHLSYITVS